MQLKQIIFENENTENTWIEYKDKMKPKMDFEFDEQKNFWKENQEAFMKEVNQKIQEYLDDEDLCNDEEDMFPQPKYMTGEWYVGEIDVSKDYLSICIRFVGIDTGKKDDYLGLEVSFFYNEETNKWCFDGINSSAI